MDWREKLKRVLDLPEDARIITKPYYRSIPKKTGKVYRALTLQYTHRGKKRYKHINKRQEAAVMGVLQGEEALYEHLIVKVREIKDLLDSVEDQDLARKLAPLRREIDRLLMKLRMRIL